MHPHSLPLLHQLLVGKVDKKRVHVPQMEVGGKVRRNYMLHVLKELHFLVLHILEECAAHTIALVVFVNDYLCFDSQLDCQVCCNG